MKHLFLALAAILTLFIATAGPSTVFAADCGGVKTSFEWNCKNEMGEGTLSEVVFYIINFLAVGVGIACLGGITFGGLTYARANGNAEMTKKGVAYIVNSIIALLLFFFMYAIMNFFVPGGLFT